MSEYLAFYFRNGHLECVQLLLKKLPSSIDSMDSHLSTSLTHATINGHSRVVRYLINKGAETDNRDGDHMTPLLRAAKCGCSIIVETLLEKGAKIDAADKNNNTALVTAALHGKSSVVTMLLDRGADVSIISLSDHNCLTAATAYGHRNVCLAIVNHSRWEEACQFENSDGHPAIKSLIEHFPDVAKVIMDKCITRSLHQQSHEDFEVTYRFEYLDRDPRGQSFSREKKFFAPKYMLQGAHKDLLFHPLTLALVRYKWQIFGLRFFYGAAMLHFLFLMLLTYYIICTKNVYMAEQIRIRNMTSDGIENYCNPATMLTWEIIIVVISVFNLCIEGYQMYVERWGYIDTSNVIELSTFSCSLVAILMRMLHYSDSHEETYWAFTVIAVLFTYLTMLIQLQSLFDTGIYVTMLFEVFKTMIKVVVFFVLVFFVYALVFHLVLSKKRNRALLKLPYRNDSDAFDSLPQSFFKTMVMTIGEVEYSRFFVDQPLDNPTLAQVVFATFCLILPIVLMNLMIGLAVGDIDSIQKNAELKRLAVQITSIDEFEEKLPSVLLRRFYQRDLVHKPNMKGKSFWGKLRCRVNDRLFNMASEQAEATEDWVQMTESLKIGMRKQEERVQILMTEVKQQKDLLNKMYTRLETCTNRDI